MYQENAYPVEFLASEAQGGSSKATRGCYADEQNDATGSWPTTESPLEELDDYDDDGSEQGGQCEQKRSLDRFAFITVAELRPCGGGSGAKRGGGGGGPSEYEICGDAGLPFLHAKIRYPSSGCCGGGGGGSGGGSGGGNAFAGFSVGVSDYSSRQAVMRVLCDRYGSVTVESPPTEVIGYVSVERVLCSLRFIVRDIFNTPRLVLRLPSYCRHRRHRSSRLARHQILLPDESVAVASVGPGSGLEACDYEKQQQHQRQGEAAKKSAMATSYTLQIPEAMSTDLKAILIAVMLLFDRDLFA